MVTRTAISALEQKHAELTVKMKGFEAKIERVKAEMRTLPVLEAEVGEAAGALAQIESAIRLLDAEWTPPPVFGRSRRPGQRR